MSAPPKVFLSHASEDKELFVRPVAEALFRKGINAWFDTWEMRPGDSLIQKIFSEGIGNSDAVVVFISTHSVSKPWVKKELNVSAVENITKNLRLIPVRLDQAEVPVVLRDQLWLDWSQEGGANGVAERISKTLFDIETKPELGDPPSYAGQVSMGRHGLTPSDELTLRAIVSIAIKSGRHMVYKEPILEELRDSDLSEDDILESCQVLINNGYVWDKKSVFYQGLVYLDVPTTTILEIATFLGYNVKHLQIRSAAMILNENIKDCQELATRLDIPKYLCEAIADDFGEARFLRVSHVLGGPARIHAPTALLKRWLLAAQAEENSGRTL